MVRVGFYVDGFGVWMYVFECGDCWFVMEDVLCCDYDGDYWFVDRLVNIVRMLVGFVGMFHIEDVFYTLSEVEFVVVYFIVEGDVVEVVVVS